MTSHHVREGRGLRRADVGYREWRSTSRRKLLSATTLQRARLGRPYDTAAADFFDDDAIVFVAFAVAQARLQHIDVNR